MMCGRREFIFTGPTVQHPCYKTKDPPLVFLNSLPKSGPGPTTFCGLVQILSLLDLQRTDL